MKVKTQISLAIGAALAASSAFALDIGTTTPDYYVFIGGSSAATPILEAAFEDICLGNDTDEYRSTTDTSALTSPTDADFGASDQNYTAYFCTAKSATPVPAALQGKKILVYKRSASGSIYGVNPVATGTAIANMVYSDYNGSTGNCVNTQAHSSGVLGHNVCLESVLTTVTDGTNQDSTIPEGGISDVEPILLQNANNLPTTGGVPVFPALAGSALSQDLSVSFPFAQGFGIAVSNDVYADLPNLTFAQIVSLLTGGVTNWHQIDSNLNEAVNVCIRQPGSGTLAGAQATFLGLGCRTNGAYTFVGTAQAFSSTGGVRGCMNTSGSIGILGLVDGPNDPPTTTDAWQFVSIDGIAPTQANLAQAVDPYYVESAITYRKKATGAAAATANQIALMNLLTSELSSATVIGNLATISGNSNLTHAIVALNASALSAVTPTYVSGVPTFNPSFPISWATKSNNTCSAAVLQYPGT